MLCKIQRQFSDTRARSVAYCQPLELEDYNLQADAFSSPPKWHLAHTTWFFETFLLKPFLLGYVPPVPAYEVLFNSYYNGVGEQYPRTRRGLLSRPTLAEVLSYREFVEGAITDLLSQRDHPSRDIIELRMVLGIEHEQQHQELFFTDLKYSLAVNPLAPAYSESPLPMAEASPTQTWHDFEGGLIEVGATADHFCFDNETPRHRVYLAPFQLASRLVTNAEYQQFINDEGYRRPELWLSDGWAAVQAHHWSSPLHWRDTDAGDYEYTLAGLIPRSPATPVCHLSYYEADAYARWTGGRLPTEQEWEHAATLAAASDSRPVGGKLHPTAAAGAPGLQQLYGDCWQWTQSAYAPYPGFAPGPGAIGEYNGKFMSSQYVLRGGSCVTHPGQGRTSYRNFFYPQDRWQFSGLRLAR